MYDITVLYGVTDDTREYDNLVVLMNKYSTLYFSSLKLVP